MNGFVDIDVERPPSIFITSHDTTIPQYYTNNNTMQRPQQQNNFTTNNNNTTSRNNIPPALTVQTHNLPHPSLSPGLNPMEGGGNHGGSPALSAYHTALNTPVSPSPSPFIPDDDIPSLYSPHSPMTPGTFNLNDTYQQQQQFYHPQPQQQQHHQENNVVMMDHHSIGAAYNSFAVGAQQRTS